MKKKSSRLLTALLILVLLLSMASWSALAAPSEENLLLNGDFQEGIECWNLNGITDSEYLIEDAGPDNSPCLVLGGHKSSSDEYSVFQTIEGAETGIYQLTLDLFRGSKGTLSVLLYAGNDPEDIYYVEALDIPSENKDWQQYTLSLDVPEDLPFITVKIDAVDYTDWLVCIDNVVLEKEPGEDPNPPTPPIPVDNLAQNGGFENAMANWTVHGDSTAACMRVDTEKSEGAYSLLMSGNSGNRVKYISQEVPVSGSGIYELSADALLPSAGQASLLTLEAKNAAGSAVASASSKPLSSSGGWQKTSLCMDVPDSAVSLTINIGAANYNHLFYMDQVNLRRTGDLHPPVNTNLLKNNSFKSGLTNWSKQGAAFTTTDQAHSGSQSALMLYTKNEGRNNSISQDYSFSASGTYTFSVFIKTESPLSGAGAALFLEAKDSAGNILVTSTSSTLSDTNGQWQTLTVSVNAPAATSTITATIAGIYCTGSFFTDDASLLFSI